MSISARGCERAVIWGGEGHSPVNIHDFLRSFFSTYSPTEAIMDGPDDPGARFGAFDFSYRLPFVRNWLTLYADSEVHDDVSPIDAPRRAAYRPGIYLSHVPGIPKLDLRVEGASTDPSHSARSDRRTAISCIGKGSRSRATPTRGSSSATGSAARTRAARPGSPGT